jgi:hypothetical protein
MQAARDFRSGLVTAAYRVHVAMERIQRDASRFSQQSVGKAEMKRLPSAHQHPPVGARMSVRNTGTVCRGLTNCGERSCRPYVDP